MRFLDSPLYWWLNRLSSYLLVGLLWLVCALPVITLFPATTSLFAVFARWRENPDDAFYLAFFEHVRARGVSDLLLGLFWLALALLLGFNAWLLPLTDGVWRAPALALLLLGVWLFAAATVFIFPLRAHYPMGLWQSARAAVILGMTQLGVSLLSLLLFALTALLVIWFPPSVLLAVPVTAHLADTLANRRLERLFPDSLDAPQGDPVEKRALKEQENHDNGQDDKR